MENQSGLYGLEYLTKLSLARTEQSDLSKGEKRNLLFSIYCMRAMFDNLQLIRPSKLMKEYSLSFYFDLNEHPLYISRKEEFDEIEQNKSLTALGGYYINAGKEDKPSYKLKVDIGTELWQLMVKSGQITGIGARMPELLSLYETVYKLVTLSSADSELKSTWYIFFPYLVMAEAAHEQDIYELIKAELINEDNFRAVLGNRYSDAICDTAAELTELGDVTADWYYPYVEYKNVKQDNGRSREVNRYYKLLGLKDFEYVIKGGEKLLNSFPFDEDIALLYIAALIGACEKPDAEFRMQRLNSALAQIEEALPTAENRLYLYYYRGVASIGLKLLDKAAESFDECLKIDENFELAKMMLKALEDDSWTKIDENGESLS